MAQFGDCLIGHHERKDGTGCVGKRQKWYFATKKAGKKTVDDIVFLDDFWECDCRCHNPKASKPTRRKKKNENPRT